MTATQSLGAAELPRLQCQQLIGRLDPLQCAGGALALTDKGRQRSPIGLNIRDDAALDLHRVLECVDTRLPARAHPRAASLA